MKLPEHPAERVNPHAAGNAEQTSPRVECLGQANGLKGMPGADLSTLLLSRRWSDRRQ